MIMQPAQLGLFSVATITPSKSEQQIKRDTLKRMAELRKLEIERLRRIIRHLCHSNDKGQRHGIPRTVTSDDLREHEAITREQRRDRGRWFVAVNNIIGAVFHGDFVRVGEVKSKWDGSHGREIKLWTLPQYENSVRSFMTGLEQNK